MDNLPELPSDLALAETSFKPLFHATRYGHEPPQPTGQYRLTVSLEGPTSPRRCEASLPGFDTTPIRTAMEKARSLAGQTCLKGCRELTDRAHALKAKLLETEKHLAELRDRRAEQLLVGAEADLAELDDEIAKVESSGKRLRDRLQAWVERHGATAAWWREQVEACQQAAIRAEHEQFVAEAQAEENAAAEALAQAIRTLLPCYWAARNKRIAIAAVEVAPAGTADCSMPDLPANLAAKAPAAPEAKAPVRLDVPGTGAALPHNHYATADNLEAIIEALTPRGGRVVEYEKEVGGRTTTPWVPAEALRDRQGSW